MPEAASLDETVAICSQLAPEDLPAMAAMGFRVFVNNRPDGEAWFGQPSHSALEAAAKAAGMTAHFVPFTLKSLQADDVGRFHALIENGEQRVLASCASGFRSALLWAAARAAFASRHLDDVMRDAAAAGQVLDNHRPLIERLIADLR